MGRSNRVNESERGALHALFNVAAAIDAQTLVTKTGQPLMVLKMEGPDDECLGPEERDAVARRFEKGLRVFSDRDRLYYYYFKSQHPPLETRTYASTLVETAVTSRLQYLTRRSGRLYRHERFMAVVSEAGGVPAALRTGRQIFQDPSGTLRRLFSKPRTVSLIEDVLTQESERLRTRVRSFQKQVEDVLPIETLDKNGAFRFLRRLANYAPHKWDGRPAHDLYLDYQICQSSLECHRQALRLDGYTVQVLTVNEAPSQTRASMWRRLQDVPCNAIVVTEWEPENTARMLKRIQTLRRHHQMIKTGLFSHFGDRQPQAHELLIDEGAEGHIYDLGQCQRELELNGRRFGRASFTIILYDEDPAKVRQAVAECYRAVSPEGATLIEERGNLLDAWLAAFPGNSHHNRRRFWLMDANVADLALLFAPKTGDPWNACLQSEYLALLETRTGSPYFFNLHHGEIAHALVLGPTGAGKSFLLNFLITFLQKYTPWTCIFDIGGSYAHLTRLFGGSYLKIGLEGRCRINPFTLPRTPENRLFLVAFVKVLIESSGCVLDQSDENDLYNQIDNLYEMDPDHRRLLSLANILSRKLRQALARWVQGGPYASLFDNVEDDLTFARFQTFEFEAMNDHPELIEPTLFYVLHRASATIVDPNELSTFKAFVADEAWRFLQNATIRDYIAEALRTWRRKNAAMILATQSVDELRQTPIFNVLLESCPTKLFLSNPQMDQRLYGELFHLTSTEAEQVASLVPRGEMLLKRPDFAKVLRLDVDPRSYWLFANSPAENLRRREIFDRHGFEEGLEILARSSQ